MSSALVNEPAYLSDPLFTAELDAVDLVSCEANGLDYPVPVPSEQRIAACCKLIRAENDARRRALAKYGPPRFEAEPPDELND